MVHGDTTRIASGAGRYNPIYYAVVGTPALPFHGAAVDYVMRVTSLLLCWLLFCAALWSTRQWARTSWPTTAIAVASTPVLAYSSAIVAPNGLEMMAGLTVWCAGVGILHRVDGRQQPRLVVLAALAASILVTTRSLGPLLFILVVGTLLVALRPDRQIIRTLTRRRSTWVAAGVVAIAGAASTVWVLSMDVLNIGQQLKEPMSVGARARYLVEDVPLWIFQTVAAFPFRDEPTRPEVYACYLFLFVAFAVYGFRARALNLRWGIALAIAVSIAVPLALSAQPGSNPTVWQGRYMLPYSVGIAILIGLALDRPGEARLSSRARMIGLGLFVVAQSVSTAAVLEKTLGKHLSDEHTFVHFSPWLVGAVAAVGSATLWYAATRPVEPRR